MLEVINSNIAPIKQAYIDPGTGSMLFTILIGLVSAVVFGLRGLFIKLKYSFSKDKTKINESKESFVIFSDDKRYWTTFKLICDEFESRKTSILFLTQSKNDPCFNEQYKYVKCEYIGEGSKGFAKLNLLHADVLLATTPGLDVYQWKRSKNVKNYVHIPHMINDITTYRMFGLDFYDAVLVANRIQLEQIKKLEQLRDIKVKDIKIVGLPYFDALKGRKDNTQVTRNKTKNVLIAPSWGKSSLLNKYGNVLLNELLKTDYHIIVRPHPQSYIAEKDMLSNLMSKYPNSERIEWNNDNDNFEVLNKSDVMISDFSGVIFDFAFIFNKPVVYADTSFDYSPYDAWWLDEELWTFKILPRIGKQLNSNDVVNIAKVIENCLDNKKLKKEILDIKDVYWKNQGNAAKEIVDYLIKKQLQLVGDKK